MQQLPDEPPTNPVPQTPEPSQPGQPVEPPPGIPDALSGHRRALAPLAGDRAVAGPYLTCRLGVQLGRGDHRLEIWQSGVVIMRARSIEHDEIELAVDNRADDAALAP